MTKREPSETQVYQFRLFIQKVSPSIWRRVQLRDDQTLAVFHEVLQIVFGWSDEFLHRFQLRGRIYAVPRAFGTAYTKSAEEVTIRDLNLRPRERFLYEYNFIDWWQVQIRLEKILPFDDTQSYPFCVNGSQAGPIGRLWRAPAPIFTCEHTLIILYFSLCACRIWLMTIQMTVNMDKKYENFIPI